MQGQQELMESIVMPFLIEKQGAAGMADFQLGYYGAALGCAEAGVQALAKGMTALREG